MRTDMRDETAGKLAGAPESAHSDAEQAGAQSIEDAFEQLQLILNNMNREDIPLEEAFSQYEKGMHLIRYCNASIDKVEKKVRILSGEEDADEF